MEKFKIRVPTASLPYNLSITSIANNTSLYTASNINDAEFEVPDAVSNTFPGFKITITDNAGKVATQELDLATYKLLQRYHVGPSVANGDFNNHVAAIAQAQSKGLSYAGVIYDRGDIQDDAAFNSLDSTVFDHTVAPAGGVYARGFDRVVREAYLTNTSNLSDRICLRVGINIVRDNVALNNGSTRTVFYGESDMNLRPDGSLTYKVVDGPVPSQMIPSYASTVVRNYTKTLLLKFMKRYLPAINDGTIMSIGLLTGTTGEAEIVTDLRETDGSKNVPSKGDFHPEMVSKFKVKFPAYNGLSNNDIANADLTNTDLGKRWTWHLSDEIRQFEWMMMDYIQANLTGFTRRKWFQIDCGSFTDALAPRRRSFNLYERVHPRTMMVKCNDLSDYDGSRHKFISEHLSSAARKYGCVAIIEPSPMNGRFDDAGGMRPYIKTQIDNCTAIGIGISFVTNDSGDIDWMISACNLTSYDVPAYKNEFRQVAGNEVLNRYTQNLSNIYATNSIDSTKSGYESYLSSISQSRCDIVIADDIKASAA